MPDLDDTDLEILRLLTEDARRSYRDIGERVDLSAPAVSDRVARLKEHGVVRRFTVDVDRSTLREGLPVLLDLSLTPGTVERVRAALRDDDAVEHVFTTAEGDVVAQARVPDPAVHRWLAESFDFDDSVEDVDVTLLANVDWSPSVEGTEFALTCAECDNTVTSEGVSARIGGERYQFCCPTCEARFRERYEQFEEGA